MSKLTRDRREQIVLGAIMVVFVLFLLFSVIGVPLWYSIYSGDWSIMWLSVGAVTVILTFWGINAWVEAGE